MEQILSKGDILEVQKATEKAKSHSPNAMSDSAFLDQGPGPRNIPRIHRYNACDTMDERFSKD